MGGLDLLVLLLRCLLAHVCHLCTLLIPKSQRHDGPEDAGCDRTGYDASLDLLLRQIRMLWKVVGLGLVHEDEPGVVAPYAASTADLGRPVDKCVGVAFGMQLGYALFGHLLQLFDLAEHDGVGRARLGAGRLEAILLPVVAQGALEGPAVVGDLGYDAVGAGGDAVAAAVADVGLDVDVVELIADDRAGG